MNKFLNLTIFVLLSFPLFSQTSIVLQNGSKLYVSNRLDSIKANITQGDTIYLPGGVLNLYGSWQIDKEVHIYGVGFYPDSSLATGITSIPSGSIYFLNGADNASIEGVHMNSGIYFGKYPGGLDSVQNVLIKRCDFGGLNLGNYSSNSGATNVTFSECVIRGTIHGQNAKYVSFEKCLINSSLNGFNGNVLFTNCIFFNWDCSGYTYTPIFSGTTNVLFKNNIFINPCQQPGAEYSTYKNNVFAFATPFSGTNSVDTTNIFLAGPDSIKFVNFSYTVNGKLYTHADNMRLQATSPAKNAGDDGTDCGIYGTPIPTKDGWIPMTPHVQSFMADPNTSNGKLPVKVRVKAQSSY